MNYIRGNQAGNQKQDVFVNFLIYQYFSENEEVNELIQNTVVIEKKHFLQSIQRKNVGKKGMGLLCQKQK